MRRRDAQHERPIAANQAATGARGTNTSAPQVFPGFDRLDANFVMVPNQFLDLCLPRCSRSCVRIVGFMIRQILGFRASDGSLLREQVTVSYTDFIRGANVSRGSLGKALAEAEEFGFIRKVRAGKPSVAGRKAQRSMFELHWDERPDANYAKDLDDFRGFFAGVGRLTPLPNQFFDHVLRSETAAVCKVVGCVLRHTVGFQDRYGGRRTNAALSYTKLRDLGGVGGPRHIAAALQHALDAGYITRVRAGHFDPDTPANSEAAVYAVRWFEPTGSEREAISPVQKGKRARSTKVSGTGSEREADARSNKGSTTKTAKTKQKTQQSKAAVAAALLEGVGIGKRTAANLVERAGVEAVMRQVEWLRSRSPARNPAGMLRRAIEEDWPAPSSPFPTDADAIEFARLAYAGLAANDGAPVAEPSSADTRAAAKLVTAVGAEAGRDFGRFVRGRVDRTPTSIAAAIRAHGDAFVRDQGQLTVRRKQNTAAEQRRRELHEAHRRPAYLAFLAEQENHLRQTSPKRYADFEADRAEKRAALAETFPDRRLQRRLLEQFDTDEARLDALAVWFEEMPRFWVWDESGSSNDCHPERSRGI
ncbi:MAG: hypothetical protein AAGD32_13020 [Planctomycetota bacterium]